MPSNEEERKLFRLPRPPTNDENMRAVYCNITVATGPSAERKLRREEEQEKRHRLGLEVPLAKPIEEDPVQCQEQEEEEVQDQNEEEQQQNEEEEHEQEEVEQEQNEEEQEKEEAPVLSLRVERLCELDRCINMLREDWVGKIFFPVIPIKLATRPEPKDVAFSLEGRFALSENICSFFGGKHPTRHSRLYFCPSTYPPPPMVWEQQPAL